MPGLGQAMFGGMMHEGALPPQPAEAAAQVTESPSTGDMSQGGIHLPPRRLPGQAPMTSLPPGGAPTAWGAIPQATPASSPPAVQGMENPLGNAVPQFGASPMLGGMPSGPASTNSPSSRLIPGAPMLPSMPQGPQGMPNSPLGAGSLLGRDTPPAPITPGTQNLLPQATIPQPSHGLSLSGFGADGSAPVAPVAPIPSGRQLSALRPSRGTNFIRLAIAAVFLIGFLGIIGYVLKDTFGGTSAEDVDLNELSTKTPAVPSPDSAPAPVPPGATEKINPIVETPTQTLPAPISPLPPPAPTLPGLPEAQAPTLTASPANTDPLGAPLPGSLPEQNPSAPVEIKTAMTPGAPPSLPGPMDATPGLPPASTPTGTPPAVTTAPAVPAQPGFAAPGQIMDSADGEKMPPAAQPALDTLKEFLAAANLNERMRHTLGTEYMKPIMQRYYSQNSDGPIQVDNIAYGRYDDNPQLGQGSHCIFHLESKTWEFPVPVMLEQRDDGWKVDWLAFIELRDRKLEAFFQGYQEGRAMFHVGIYRQHYFEDDVPNRSQKDTFSVGLPRPNPFRKPVFLSKDSLLSKQLSERLPWETHVWAIVELEWKKIGTQQWVELVSIPQMHWYSLPSRPVSTPDKAPAAASEEKFPPGIRRSPATRAR
ncbi:MAG: hypothetical protein IPK32_15050 [Verrucomicrobiaceae bacterium]|nr:hypothetical protein [Verrucomicrobiaceae bacterium]